MFKFNCEKCTKGFNKISHLKAHLNKKKPCDKNKNQVLTSSDLLLTPPPYQNLVQVIQPVQPAQLVQTIQIDEDESSFKCDCCSIIFKKKYNLERHIKGNRCKVTFDIKVGKSKNNIISSNEELNILLKEQKVDEQTKLILNLMFRQNNELVKLNSQLKSDYESLKNEIGKLKQTTINNTLNNQNNIIIAHGNEDFNKIELKTIIEHLATADFKKIIPNMVKHVYINDSKPEYKNFCVVDLARNKCQYHNGKKWVAGKTNDRIIKIFDNVNTMLTEPFEKDKLLKTIQFIQNNEDLKTKSTWINYSKNYLLSLWDENDKENVENKNDIINELKLVFYNNKNEILKITLDEIN